MRPEATALRPWRRTPAKPCIGFGASCLGSIPQMSWRSGEQPSEAAGRQADPREARIARLRHLSQRLTNEPA
ncbi:hypothetical protein GCM10010448_66120 [Streptomyces glomeratus]|uniref:Uncharacterized protein n=1 Tax=Streptomyces glomeratus TaxID=284452 RepID=A0ABP6M8C6_9ACTN